MTPPHTNATDFNPARRFVRVTGEQPNGFVEFDFAIGDPDVFVELVLPVAAFKQFCSHNRVTMLEGDAPHEGVDGSWRMSEALRRHDR